LPAFIAANCTVDALVRCLIRDFQEAYVKWTRDMGYTLAQTQHAVTRNLENLGYTTKKGNKGVAVLGLTLHKENE